MIEILDKYKNRLINISGRNRSLVSKKLYKKRAFDLYKLSRINSTITEEIVDFIWNKKDGVLEVCKDYSNYIQDKIDEIEKITKKNLDNEIKEIKLKKYLKEEDRLIEEAQQKFNENKQLQIEKVKEEGKELADNSSSINYLFREINSLEKETGRYELYIGYPFVEGYFKEGTFTKAPLFLFPVKVFENKGNWYLENISAQDVILNKVFLLACSKYNNIELEEIETEFDKIYEKFVDINDVINYISKYGITISKSDDDKLTKFKEIKKDTILPYENGQLKIINNIILGQFPVANSIYNDYQELINIYNSSDLCKENVLLNKLLLNDASNNEINYDIGKFSYEDMEVLEKDFYFISPLDYSQEKAAKTVNETDQLVIYGPPGTGKSQAISNIISDSLAKGNKVLMVSQKRAALDVIYNRLGKVNSKTVLIHDSNKDKKSFYEKVVQELNNSLKNEEHKLNEIISSKAKVIDEEIVKLTKLQHTLIKERKFGLTLQEMYTLSKNLDASNKIKYDRYRIFRKNNLTSDLTYNKLKNICQSLKEKNCWEDYRDYRDYKDNNPSLEYLKENMDSMDVEDHIDEITNLMHKYSNNIYVNITNDIYINKYNELYKAFDDEISLEEVTNLASKINRDKNSILLNPIQKSDFEKNYIEKKENFNTFFEIYKELDDNISDEIVNEIANEINVNKNKYLLDKVKKSLYLEFIDRKHNENFNAFMDLYDDLEIEVDNYRIEELVKKINSLENGHLLNPLKKEDYIKNIDLSTKMYFEDFYSLYTYLEEEIHRDKIVELGEKINIEENKYLLEKINYGNWWTISYWKNRKINKQKEIENKSNYEKRKEQIINLLLKYNEELNEYIKKTKLENKNKYKILEQQLINQFVRYKEEINEFVKNEKKKNKDEYNLRKEIIFNELNKYRNDISSYVEERMFKNKNEYEKREKEIYNILYDYKTKYEEFKNDLIILNNFIKEENLNYYKELAYERKNLTLYLKEYIDALKVYDKYREKVIYLSQLSYDERKFLRYIYKYGDSKLSINENIDEIFEFTILYNINEIEKEEKIDLLIYKDFNQIVDKINDLMKEKQSLTPEYIINALNESFNFYVMDSNGKSIREFERQASKKRMLWAIRKYLYEYIDILLNLFPCWLLGPETVSEILPLISGIYDLVIFDEASQMFIENAIPTIYRGKKVIIAGDDKQLRPTAMFKSKIDIDEEEIDDSEVAAALEEESLLDLAKVNYDSVYLNYHYRSRYDELINFSNYAFYGGRLQVAPNSVKTDFVSDKPIERIKVNGRWINRKNEKEAEEVVKLVKSIFLNRKNNETIGIITFNINQQELIEDYLDIECNNDPMFKSLYIKEKNRIENSEDVSIFIKNIENVQGDERDVIIFSVGYGRNEKDRVSLNFGSLSQDGGENRLNVAISRAKEKIYVITSIEPEEMGSVENTKNNGPKFFKKYLEYVRCVSDGDKEGAKIILNSLLDSDIKRDTVLKFDSPFEEEVYDSLIKSGLCVDTQIGVSGYKIDLGVYDTETSKYIIGIECDGSAYHSSKVARERDIHRQRYLESRGWKIHRIWSRDWWNNPQEEVNKILEKIKEIN